MGPKRLWTGDWSAQSAASRARMAEQRGLVAPEPEPVLEPVAEPDPEPFAPPPPSLRELIRGGLARLLASARALAAELRRPSGTRVRLGFIALIAAAAGAGVVIGVQASSPSGASAGTGAYLGVELGSPVGQAGALVEFVQPGSPAQVGGLELGDVITAIDGHAVSNPDDASNDIASQQPGASALIALDRFGQPLTLTVRLGRRPGAP